MLATLEAPKSARGSGEWDELAALVRLAQEGDREAFGLLVEQFERTVHSICLRRLGNQIEAAELSQEVFIHVMRRIHQLREPERFAGWLRQVAVRMSINRATRRLAPTSVEPEILAETCSQAGEPIDDLIARERAQRLWEAMDLLKEIDREVLTAFYIRGRSLVEIAAELEVPIGTIKRRLHTARRRLKAGLEARSADAEEWGITGAGADDPEEARPYGRLDEADVSEVFEMA